MRCLLPNFRRAGALCLVAFVSMLILQSAWILAIDPFRAIDEFDHAQRADAVASGQWLAPESGLVSVNPQLNRAALPVCLSRPRRSAEACPASTTPDGRAVVASTAAAYNPVFYWIVGTASQPFTDNGYHQLYAMRFATALLNALTFSGRLLILLAAFRSRWPYVMAMASISPMAAYTSVVVAPNGLEIATAFCLWSAVLGLRFGRTEFRSLRWPWIVIGFCGAFMGILRTLGPFWLVCIVGCIAVAAGRDVNWLRRRSAVATATVIGVSSLAGGAWTLLSGTNRVDESTPLPDPSLALTGVSTGQDSQQLRNSRSRPSSGCCRPLAPFPTEMSLCQASSTLACWCSGSFSSPSRCAEHPATSSGRPLRWGSSPWQCRSSCRSLPEKRGGSGKDATGGRCYWASSCSPESRVT